RDPGQNGPRTVTAPAAGCGFVAHRLLRPGAGGTGCAGGGGRPRARGGEPPRGHGRADRTQASPRELLPVRPATPQLPGEPARCCRPGEAQPGTCTGEHARHRRHGRRAVPGGALGTAGSGAPPLGAGLSPHPRPAGARGPPGHPGGGRAPPAGDTDRADRRRGRRAQRARPRAATPPAAGLPPPVTQIAPIDDEDGEHSEPAPAPRRAPAHRPAAPAAAGSELENTGAYDDLFGKTVFRRIEDAAVRRSEEEHDEESADSGRSGGAAGESPSPAPTPAEPDPGPDADPAPSRTAAESEFIDWVPGVGRAAPEIARTAARRAAAPPPAEPAYPQVHMAQRPPHPNTGSRPAPTRPSMPPPAPYERPGNAAFAGPPMNTGAAGQQLGYPSRSGPPSPHPGAAVNPGAAGHQLGFPSP